MSARCRQCGQRLPDDFVPAVEGALVSNARLRQAFEASTETAAAIARRAGYVYRGKPDVTHVKRALGLKPDTEGYVRTRIREATAKRLTEALNLDPVDVGL